MKKILLLALLVSIASYSQDHFSGITTSKRVGILSVGLNPSELSNLNNHLEVQLFTTSINVSNNKIGFKDIVNGSNLDNILFKGTEPVNFNMDAEIAGPGIAIKLLNWGFAISSKGYIKGNIIDVDPNLGSALTNGILSSVNNGVALISSNSNQRMNATTWGEIGFSASHKLFENKKQKLNGGVTLKLLFPGAYANVAWGRRVWRRSLPSARLAALSISVGWKAMWRTCARRRIMPASACACMARPPRCSWMKSTGSTKPSRMCCCRIWNVARCDSLEPPPTIPSSI